MIRWTRTAHEIAMGILAIASIWLAFQPEHGPAHWLSVGIWAVFLVEYVARLVLARERGRFVVRHVPELVASVPYELVAMIDWDPIRGTHFEYMRLVRFARLLRFVRLWRGFSMLWRVSEPVRGVLRTNNLRYVILMTGTFIVFGGVGICAVEDGAKFRNVGDGLWWALVTTATVGYGDLYPESVPGRLIAAALMLLGIGTLGMITASIATYFLGQRHATNPHVRHVQEQLDHWEEMSHAERRELARMLHAMAGDDPDAMPGRARLEARPRLADEPAADPAGLPAGPPD